MLSGTLDDVLACEERLVNCWPALDTLLMDGWAVRFANGYSGRANSASAVVKGARMDDGLIDEVVAFFGSLGLPPAIRVSPLAAEDVAPRLLSRGWQPVTQSIGMIAPAPEISQGNADLHVSPVPDAGWIAGVSALQDARKRNGDHLLAIVGRLRRDATFATIRKAGRDVAFGMSVIDRGMAELGSIIVDPSMRGQGIGRQLVTGLMGWAVAAGAERLFLQVEASNRVARALYDSLGFRDVYGYTEYRLIAGR